MQSGFTQVVSSFTDSGDCIVNLVMSDVPDLYKLKIGYSIGRFDLSLVSNELNLLLDALGYDFSFSVVSRPE